MNSLRILPQQSFFLYGLAIVTSIILSAWMNAHQDIINPDAICYLSSAQAIGQFGIKQAMHLCGQAQWPFYSALIYGFVKFSHLPYETAAYILNGLFSAISVVTFVLICKELGASKRILWLAACVILSSHAFNGVRQYIVRDHGFWAFYLISILMLMRYVHQMNWKNALGFSASLMIAALFRIEGAMFLIALPFIIIFINKQPASIRIKQFVQLQALPLMAFVFIAIWLLLHPDKTLAEFGRVHEIPQQITNGFHLMAERFTHAKMALQNFILNEDSTRDAGMILALMLPAWYFVSVANNLTWIYLGLFLGGFYIAYRQMNAARRVLNGYLILNVLITFGFLLERFFLSKRYLVALILIMMLYLPFVIDYLIVHRAQLKYRLMLWLTICSMVFYGVYHFTSINNSKAYIADAGEWLHQNVPANANLYVNDYQLMYYSKHFGNDIFNKISLYLPLEKDIHQVWPAYHYLAFRINQKQLAAKQHLFADVPFQPIKTYTNARGDSVVIYQVPHQEKLN